MHKALMFAALIACGKSEPAVDRATGDPVQAPVGKHEDRHEPIATPAKLVLDIYNAGQKTTWGEAEFTAVAKMAGSASDGEARDTWSVRELVHHHFGATARAITVIGSDGRQAIAPPEWEDSKRTPILHTTRKGSLKFRWADETGKWGETVMKDVSGLEIVTK